MNSGDSNVGDFSKEKTSLGITIKSAVDIAFSVTTKANQVIG